ncbi:hypothetical protein [Cupriavidus plantarum]|uniref:Metal binding Ada-like protein n=1 Tax=Cupriavidus plantarum TaxID=942865 RepID=A0A316F1Q1_9BURK|nr:hypothetical protein [Cupriavidus plantarum]PWK37658.1 hypothetical protein C7419_1011541 [Cupriavidus plantarum]
MPLPNGVTPDGTIERICPRASWMGNRGTLHNEAREIVRAWTRKAWVTCRMSFNGRNRQPLMQPDRYTELFFLDEATALAAGHRPCGECRREDFTRFKQAWAAANGLTDGVSIGEIDKRLHEERTGMDRRSGEWRRPLRDLPTGTMVEAGEEICVWAGDSLLTWTPSGYNANSGPCNPSDSVRLVTPPSLVQAIRAGYSVQIDDSCTHSQNALVPLRV